MIQIHHISKIFGQSTTQVQALNNIDLHIKENEFIVVRGPSGSGKTTLLLIIGTMQKPSSGSVQIENKNIFQLSENDRTSFRAHNIGFVFQDFHLVPYLNVMENIMISAGLNRFGDYKEQSKELAAKLGLSDRVLHYPSQLSTGEQQRVGLARALIHKPKIILADEPTGNLDPESSSVVIDILRDYQQNGGTLIVVTHGKNIDKYASRILKLNKGEIAR